MRQTLISVFALSLIASSTAAPHPVPNAAPAPAAAAAPEPYHGDNGYHYHDYKSKRDAIPEAYHGDYGYHYHDYKKEKRSASPNGYHINYPGDYHYHDYRKVKREASPEPYHDGYGASDYIRQGVSGGGYHPSSNIKYGGGGDSSVHDDPYETGGEPPAMVVAIGKRDDSKLAKRGVCITGGNGSCNFQCKNNVSINCPNGTTLRPSSGSCGGFLGAICQCNYSSTCNSGGGGFGGVSSLSNN